MITAYKVVTSSYHSVFARGKYEVYYKEGTVVKMVPGTVGLMAFDTFANALKFTQDNGARPTKILAVEYPATAKLPPSTICPYTCESDLDRSYRLGTSPFLITAWPPQGTIFLSSLTVIEWGNRKVPYEKG